MFHSKHSIYFILYLYIVVSASYHGFFAKWVFMETYPLTYSDFYSMYDNTARKPSCYRFFSIQSIKFLVSLINSEKKNKIQNYLVDNDFISKTYSKAIIKKEAIIEYYCLYFLCFICFFFASILFYKICVNVTQNQISSFLAVCLFDLVLPYLETNSGFFYDFSELLFFSITIYLVIKGYWKILFLTSIFATLNKETFIPFLLCLYPFFKLNLKKQKNLQVFFCLIIICGLIHIIRTNFFYNNLQIPEQCYASVAAIYFFFFFIISIFIINNNKLEREIPIVVSAILIILLHLKETLTIVINAYMHFEMNYMPSGGRLFFIHLFLIIYLIKSTYKYLNMEWKEHFFITICINTLLFFIFCNPYELRDFSMLYPCFIIMLANYFSKVVGIYCKEPINKKL